MWTKSLAQQKSHSHRKGIKQALVQAEPCEEALEMTEENMRGEMDYFSRSFDKKHYDNAMHIWGELKKNGFKG
jgi:hypothetical protein